MCDFCLTFIVLLRWQLKEEEEAGGFVGCYICSRGRVSRWMGTATMLIYREPVKRKLQKPSQSTESSPPLDMTLQRSAAQISSKKIVASSPPKLLVKIRLYNFVYNIATYLPVCYLCLPAFRLKMERTYTNKQKSGTYSCNADTGEKWNYGKI